MRNIVHSLSLLLVFLTLSVGSSVTLCHAASFAGIELHGPADHTHGHQHDNDCHHDEKGDDTTRNPCGGECAPALEEVTPTSTIRLPELPHLATLPIRVSNLEEGISQGFSFVLLPEPSPPPSPPCPALTGCFRI